MSVAALLAAPQLRANRPLEMQVRGSANISTCETYRWSLRRWWFTHELYDGLILPWIMLNPSTADAAVDDQTLQRIIGFSYRWGFDGLLVVNLFPFRSPKPSMLQEWLKWEERQDTAARDAIWENESAVAELLQPFDAAIAAWGAPGGKLGFATKLAAESLFDAVNKLRETALQVFCLDETAAGEPKHPMARGLHRVPDNIVPKPMQWCPGAPPGLGAEPRATLPLPGAHP